MTTEIPTPSPSGVIKCPCGTRFHKDQRHTCDFYDNSATTIDALDRGSFRADTRPSDVRRSDFIDPPENNGGSGRGHRPDTRTNRFAGTCIKCGGRVEAEAGYLVKDNSKTGGSPWGVEHKIGECLAESVEAPAPVARGNGMSEAQEGYLRSLLARKQPEADADGVIAAFTDVPNPRKLASAMIDTLKGLPDAPKPKAAKPADAPDLNRGDVHVVEGDIEGEEFVHYYRVHVAQGSGNLYACKWDGVRFEYERGAISKLNPGNKITAEQAAAFGEMFSRCCFCSHQLDTPESTAVGYGPVCASKHDLPWG